MATPDTYNAQPMQQYPNTVPSDVCHFSSAPMQPTAPQPPPLYPSVVAPPPPPYQVPMYTAAPVLMTQTQVQYPNVIVAGNFIPPQTVFIKDYMVWSIINVFLGGFLLGLIAVLLSSQTRNRKREGDVAGARTMSNITLACNILITIIFFATTAFLIVYFVIVFSAMNELY